MTDHTRPPFVTDDLLDFLDRLRASGQTNADALTLWVGDRFLVTISEARQAVRYWQAVRFAERHPA